MARPGGQSQYSVRMSAGQPRHGLLRKLLDDIATDPATDHSLNAMAGRVNVSPRQLSRLFRAELGTTPATYVEQTRVEAAKAMVESGPDAVEVIARRTGLGTAETMRRAFVRTLERDAQRVPGPLPHYPAEIEARLRLAVGRLGQSAVGARSGAYDDFGGTRTVDVHVRRLRAKLGSEYESMIGTVRQVGDKFVVPPLRALPDPETVPFAFAAVEVSPESVGVAR